MIDDLFYLIINKSNQISNEFFELLKRLEMDYTEYMLMNFQADKIQMIKEIIYVLYSIEKDNLKNILFKVKREELLNMYNLCKTFETDNFLAYYKKSIINKYMS
jgi:hypothetical protein